MVGSRIRSRHVLPRPRSAEPALRHQAPHNLARCKPAEPHLPAPCDRDSMGPKPHRPQRIPTGILLSLDIASVTICLAPRIVSHSFHSSLGQRAGAGACGMPTANSRANLLRQHAARLDTFRRHSLRNHRRLPSEATRCKRSCPILTSGIVAAAAPQSSTACGRQRAHQRSGHVLRRFRSSAPWAPDVLVFF